MNLVDEQHIALVQVGEQRRQVTRVSDGRAGGDADIHAHLVGDDVRKRRLAKPRRPVEQDMVERLAPCLGRLDEDAHLFLHLALADIFLQRPWPQTRLYD